MTVKNGPVQVVDGGASFANRSAAASGEAECCRRFPDFTFSDTSGSEGGLNSVGNHAMQGRRRVRGAN